MTKGCVRTSIFLATALVIASLQAPALAQLVLGQYEDEAPLRTWNVFGIPSAAAVGLGGARFAAEEAASAALTNPALLSLLPGYSLTLTGSSTSATLFRYSLVNTGVVTTQGNVRALTIGLAAGSVSFRLGDWGLAFTSSLLESYLRPAVAYDSTTYFLAMWQTGWLRGFSASAARSFGRKVSVGIGATVAAGRLTRSIDERWPDSEIAITDDRSEKFRGLFFNGGLRAELAPWVAAALVVRTPYVRTSKGASLLRYEAPLEGTDIRIEAEARNEYRQPWILGIGTKLRLGENLAAAADLAYFGWSGYSVLYFDEALSRPFRDVVQVCGGIEYSIRARVRAREAAFPLRLGFSVDPQPMTRPRSAYSYFSLGTGFHLGRLAVDAASRFGWERGSGDDLAAAEAVLTVRYSLGEGK